MLLEEEDTPAGWSGEYLFSQVTQVYDEGGHFAPKKGLKNSVYTQVLYIR